MEYENKVVRVQRVFFHTLPDMIENWGKEGYRIINTNQSKTFSGEEEIVIFLEREVEEKKQKTNYGRIKSMSVEDLTKFISNITKVVAVKLGNDYVVNNKQFIQQWLLQEVRDE